MSLGASTSRLPAIVSGAATAITFATATVAALILASTHGLPAYRGSASPPALILTAIPGTIGLAAIFAIPSAWALVLAMTEAANRLDRRFDHPAAWLAAAFAIAAPTALLFWALFSDIAVPAYVLALGTISGLAAWWKRPRL